MPDNDMTLKGIRRLLHAHANWAHQAIHEQHLPENRKTLIYGPGDVSDTVVTEYAMWALIATSNRQAVEEFVAGFRPLLIRPGMYFGNPIDKDELLTEYDAHLANYKAKGTHL